MWDGAMSLQSCLTLCDPMDCSPPGSSVHGDSPGKNTGVGCHALLQGIFPIQGLSQGSLTLQADSLPTELLGKPFPASGSSPVSWLFISGGQSIGASASTTVLPMNIQGWFPLGWTDYIHCMPFGNFDYENDKSLKMNTWNGQHMWVHMRLE